MIKAVVYESHTGFTERYAKRLAGILELPAYAVKEAEKKLTLQSEIVFLGWICAGKIMGYEQAARAYRIQAVCAVGIMFSENGTSQKLADGNRITRCPVFCLPGGYRHDQLGVVYRMMAKVMAGAMMNKADKTEHDEFVLRVMKEGADFVNEEYLDSVICYIKGRQEMAI